ncbi:MAG TPA: hypothetical protein VFQ67_05885 [Allosphingosinicella sp.]|jgi:hypothetical protein|nr:hypothetical protein [Allosphingosinicella sp.]
MTFILAPEWSHMAVATAGAFLLGWLLCWGMDRLFMKEVVDDRIAGIALSCAVAFVVIMFWATVVLTWLVRSDPYIGGRPIVIPPFPYAVSLILGLAAVGVLRTILYGREYEEGEEELVFDPDIYDQAQYDEEVLAWDEQHRHKNYFSRHWAGHLSLPVSFWINGALLSALIAAAVEAAGDRIRDNGGTLRGLAVVALAYAAFSALFWVWSAVGIWRSAYWHRRRGGTPGWGLGARILVVLFALVVLARSGDIALRTRELGTLAAGGDVIGPVAEMKASADGRDLSLRGNLAAGSAERFEAMLEAGPGLRRVLLSSSRGRYFEAERIAALIRGRGLDTRVEDVCLAPCTDLLLAGRERTAPERARIGFHQPNFPADDGYGLRKAVERTRADWLAAGVKPEFVERVLITPAQAMWFPDPAELVEANVLTGSDVFVTKGGERRRETAAEMRLRRNMAATAERINATLPRRLSEDTTILRVSASGTTLTHHYRLDADAIDAAGTRQGIGRQLRRQVCADVNMALAIREGARFVHSYSDRRGRHAVDIVIDACP